MKRPTPTQSLRRVLCTWRGQPDAAPQDLWVFAYASLIWRPEFEEAERRPATVYGWHRDLNMWSTVNRGTPEVPGLVFALLPGGSCQGMAVRMPAERVERDLPTLWQREMPNGVYDPLFLRCKTPKGAVNALAFTLRRTSPRCCGSLSTEQLSGIFAHAQGRYGSTKDYALQTYQSLIQHRIEDLRLKRLLLQAGVTEGELNTAATTPPGC